MRFWDVRKGSVKVSGVPVREINTRNLRELESFVTQETHLFHDSIKNNLRLAKLDATDEEIVAAARDYGAALGMAFQIRDDMLDGDGFAALLGPEKCQAMAEGYTQDAFRLLNEFEDTEFLQEMTEKLCGRKA